MKAMKPITRLLLALLLTASCGIYSFSGTSIQPDVNTITIEPVVNKAMKVNPSLASTIFEQMCDKYKKLTKLQQVDEDGDLNVLTTIESYQVSAAAVTANEVAALNRLTVTVKVKFVNSKHPEENFEKSFAAYEDYDSVNSLDAVEAQLCDAIVEKLIEDIFNATVANW